MKQLWWNRGSVCAICCLLRSSWVGVKQCHREPKIPKQSRLESSSMVEFDSKLTKELWPSFLCSVHLRKGHITHVHSANISRKWNKLIPPMFVFPNFALVNMTKTMQDRISTFDNFIFCSFLHFLYSFQSRVAVDFVSLARWKGQNQEEDKKRKQRQLWCERLYFCDRRGWVLISLLTSFQDHLSIGLKSAKKSWLHCLWCF